MTNGVSLDDLRRESEKRYANYPIDLSDGTTVVLLAPLRMDSEQRDQVRDMQGKLQAMQQAGEDYRDAELLELLREMIRTCAEEHGQDLVDEIGEDLALLQTLFEDYTERTQAGEASHSVG